GVRPSNTGRGYVLRRLLRRALTLLWRDDPSRTLDDLPDDVYGHTLSLFEQQRELGDVRDVLGDEERRFRRLVGRGRSVVQRQLRRGPLTEEDFRYLHDTHGLPRDLIDTLLAA